MAKIRAVATVAATLLILSLGWAKSEEECELGIRLNTTQVV
jgi:hypothetical protein